MKFFITLLCTLSAFLLNAQAAAPVAMADQLRSDGGIYVVLAVIAIIMSGLFGYLIYIDLKLKKIENGRGNK